MNIGVFEMKDGKENKLGDLVPVQEVRVRLTESELRELEAAAESSWIALARGRVYRLVKAYRELEAEFAQTERVAKETIRALLEANGELKAENVRLRKEE